MNTKELRNIYITNISSKHRKNLLNFKRKTPLQILKEILTPEAPISLINHLNFKKNFTEILQALNFQSELKFIRKYSKEETEIYLVKRLKICIKLLENLTEPEFFKPVFYNLTLIINCFEIFSIKIDFEEFEKSYSFQSVLIHRTNSCILAGLNNSGMITQLFKDVLINLFFEKKWKILRNEKLKDISFELDSVDPWCELVLVFEKKSREFEFFVKKFSGEFWFVEDGFKVKVIEKFSKDCVGLIGKIKRRNQIVEEGVDETIIRMSREKIMRVILRNYDQEIKFEIFSCKSKKKIFSFEKKILALGEKIEDIEEIRLYGNGIYYKKKLLFELNATISKGEEELVKRRFSEFKKNQYIFRFFFNCKDFDINFIPNSHPLKTSKILTLTKNK